MLAAFVPIEGTNLTTAIYSLTTIDNEAFGVQAGQSVELLLLQINSGIPTNLLFLSAVEQWSEPLGEMAQTIADSVELRSRIQALLDG